MKKAMKPAAEISKFAGMRAPLMANTSGVFDRPMLASSRGGTISIPGFAPVNAFPYPGIMRGNASQIDGLLPGSGRVDMVAANIYRMQDRQDDVASGIGVTGLNSAPKGNRSGAPMVRIKKEGDPLDAMLIRRRIQLANEAARFEAYNPGLGNSRDQPIPIDQSTQTKASSNQVQTTTAASGGRQKVSVRGETFRG